MPRLSCGLIHWPVSADSNVYFIDSDRNKQVVLAGPAIARTRFYAAATGTVNPQQTPETPASVKWLRAALDKPDLADVLRIIGKPEATWSQLYTLLTLVELIIGKKVNEAGWIPRNQRKRFRKTANSRRAVGVEARHGEDYDPPANPMSLEEARRMGRQIAERLLNDALGDDIEDVEQQADS